MKMTLNTDKTRVNLEMNADMTATDMDALIRKLALLRADMTPAVPATRDELEQVNMEVLIEDKPGLVIAARQDGGFRLWLRHRGYGWLAYQIDNLSATGMHSYLGTRIRPEVNLVQDGNSNTH